MIAALALPVVGAIDSGPGSSFVPVSLVAAYVLFNRFVDLTCTLLRGVGRFTFEAVLQSVGAAAFIAAAIATTAAGLGVTAVLAVLCVKEFVSAVVSYQRFAATSSVGKAPGATPTGAGCSGSASASIAAIALALVMRVPLALLGNIGTTSEVALFSAAQRFGDAAYILAISLGVGLLPGITYLARVDLARARRCCTACSWPSSPAARCSPAPRFLAEPLMHGIFGSDFTEGVDLLRIVLIGMPAYGALGICWYAVIAFDGEADLVGIGLLGLAVCVVLGVTLIPPAGDVGAAWTYVISLCATAGLSFAVLERRIGRKTTARTWEGRKPGSARSCPDEGGRSSAKRA